MKLLIDMNLSPRWATYLGQHGLSARHWSDLGAANATDTEIMAFARANDFVVLTHDLDFTAILAATNASGPSVIQVRAGDVSPEAIGGIVVKSVTSVASDIQSGAIVTVSAGSSRVRVLPLRRP